MMIKIRLPYMLREPRKYNDVSYRVAAEAKNI